MKAPSETRRILVLAVDRDDDLGSVGVKTPIVGREEVLRAALHFALERPEDSDLNVLFAALKIYRDLLRKGISAEVAVVSGHPIDTIEADMRIRDQTLRLVSEIGASEILLVSDGAEDELVIPVLQQIAPIVSVKRVVVEQYRGVEETYILIGRFLRKVVEEPRFARLFLGVPGIVLSVFSALALVGYFWQALLVGLLVAGLAMVVRGFGIEDALAEIVSRAPLIIVVYGISGTIASVGLAVLAMSMASSPQSLTAIADSARTTLYLLAFAISLAVLGHAINKVVQNDYRIAGEATVTAIVVVVTVLIDLLLKALAMIGANPTPQALAAALDQESFVVYAVGGIAAIMAVWRVMVKLEERLMA
ncbi:MAG: DUF373 family protein [Pyrodictiaceae archaeon]